MSQDLQARTSDRLLQSLPKAEQALLAPHLIPVKLKFRQRLEIPQRRSKAVYFPQSGIASVIARCSDGRRQAEIAIVGWGGMTAVSTVLGLDRSPNETVMQIEGAGQCIAVGRR